MDQSSVTDYLSKLLNRPIGPDASLRLTSAQRARLNAWLHGQGLPRDDKLLAGEFTVAQLQAGNRERVAAPGPQATPFATLQSGEASSSQNHGLSIGIDIQSVEELLASSNRNDFKADAELNQLFTMKELSYAQSKSNPDETLAGLFAAKEAVRKCMNVTELSADAFRAIEVLPNENGRPCTAGFELSISHSGGLAVAVATTLPQHSYLVSTQVTPINAGMNSLKNTSKPSHATDLYRKYFTLMSLMFIVICILNLMLLWPK